MPIVKIIRLPSAAFKAIEKTCNDKLLQVLQADSDI